MKPLGCGASLALLAAVAPGVAAGAGNVTVSARRILGDEAANRIRLEPGAGGRTLVAGFDGTTVNGGPAALVELDDSPTIALEGGDDTIVLQDIDVATRLTVKSGPGDDAVHVTGGSTGKNLSLDGGDGADEIVLTAVAIGYNASIDGGEGDDDIQLASVGAGHIVTLNGGRGDDTVVVAGMTLRYPFHLSTTTGEDQVVVEDSTFFSNFRVELGREDDDLTIRNVTVVDGATILDGGPGANGYTDGGGNRFLEEVRITNLQRVE